MGIKGDAIAMLENIELIADITACWNILTQVGFNSSYHWDKIGSIGSINVKVEKQAFFHHSLLDVQNLNQIIDRALLSCTHNPNNNQYGNMVLVAFVELLLELNAVHSRIEINLDFMDALFSHSQ